MDKNVTTLLLRKGTETQQPFDLRIIVAAGDTSSLLT